MKDNKRVSIYLILIICSVIRPRHSFLSFVPGNCSLFGLCPRTDIRAHFRVKLKLMEALFMVQYSGFCLRADLRKAVFNQGIKQSKSIGKIIIKHKKKSCIVLFNKVPFV